MTQRISQLTAAGTLTGAELLELSTLSATVTITATTLSALASDNSYNDSGNGFVTAGFTVGDQIRVTGFTGNAANNIFSASVTAVTAGKLIIGGTDGNVIVDDAAGESVTITKWLTRRATSQDIANLVAGGGGGSTQGKHSIPVTAAGMRPSLVNGCSSLFVIASASNQPDIATLDFDASTEEYAQFAIPMPKKWNEGTITAKFIWSHAATTTNFGVVWALQAVAVSDDDAIAAAYGTAQTVTDTGGTTNDIYMSAETSAITIAGTPAPEDLVFFRAYRVAANGSDTLAIDARLHAVVIYITTNADTDA